MRPYRTDPEHNIVKGRPSDLAIRAEPFGMCLEREGDGFRLVAERGTVVAGDWGNGPGFYGLDLDAIEAVLDMFEAQASTRG